MNFQLTTCSIYHVGKRVDKAGRPHQEDSLYPNEHIMQPGTTASRLFIVCDGMGGHDAGEVASATVCDTLSQSITQRHTSDGPFTDNDLQQAIDDAYDALDVHDTGAFKKMGTTLTLLKFHEAGCTIAHMGDSRVYHIRPGRDGASTRILHVTSDHSFVNELVKLGVLTPEQAKTHPQKNIITRCMQPNQERRERTELYHTADIRPGDYFYLCSDGMLEQMDDDELCRYFSQGGGDIDAKATNLELATRDNSDNHTAILVRVDHVEGEPVCQPEPVVGPAVEPDFEPGPARTSTAGSEATTDPNAHRRAAQSGPTQSRQSQSGPTQNHSTHDNRTAGNETDVYADEEEDQGFPFAPYFSPQTLRAALLVVAILLLIGIVYVRFKYIRDTREERKTPIEEVGSTNNNGHEAEAPTSNLYILPAGAPGKP